MILNFINYLKVALVVVLRATFEHVATPEKFRWVASTIPGRLNPDSGIEIYRHNPAVIEKYPVIVVSANTANAKIQAFNKEKLEQKNEFALFETNYEIPVNGIVPITNIMTDRTISVQYGHQPFTRVYKDPLPSEFLAVDSSSMLMFNAADVGKTVKVNGTVYHYWMVYGGKMTIQMTMDIFSLSPMETEELTDLVVIYARHLFRDKFLQYGIIFTDISIGGEKERNLASGRVEFGNSVTIDCYTEYENRIDLGLYTLIKDFNIESKVKDIETLSN